MDMEMKSTNFVNVSCYYDPQTRLYHFWFNYEEVLFNEEDFNAFTDIVSELKFWGKPVS